MKMIYSLQDVKDLLLMSCDDDHGLKFEKVVVSGYGETMEFTLSELTNHEVEEEKDGE
jgi:hypothetical protein